MSNTVTCPECSEEWVRIGSHWSNSDDCSHPSIPVEWKEIVEGILMGDGYINVQEESKYPRLKLQMTNKEYLEWVSDTLDWLSCDVLFFRTGEEAASAVSSSNHPMFQKVNPEEYRDQYSMSTRTHPYFSELRGWYGVSGKEIPSSVSLTPIKTKMWYCCDGSVNIRDRGSGRCVIHSRDMSEYSDRMVEKFSDVGFDVGYRSNGFWFTVDESKRFLDWIGDPVPGFEYKFVLDDVDSYKRMKEEQYE